MGVSEHVCGGVSEHVSVGMCLWVSVSVRLSQCAGVSESVSVSKRQLVCIGEQVGVGGCSLRALAQSWTLKVHLSFFLTSSRTLLLWVVPVQDGISTLGKAQKRSTMCVKWLHKEGMALSLNAVFICYSLC